MKSSARSAASSPPFEEPVKKLSGNWGYIDLFWPGVCIVEHKSAAQDLDKAHAQGMDYIRGTTFALPILLLVSALGSKTALMAAS